MRRRHPLLLLAVVLALLGVGAGSGQAADARSSSAASPAEEWVKGNPFGMFLHYGMGTYTDAQWADPNTPASRFDPSGMDPDQWAETMKSAGMTFGVLTAKHHDGFSLWPTAQSDYDVSASPYQGGKGDVVREYVDAMRAKGLKVGLYFSIWDRHNGETTELVKKQLTELLTQYGKIDYLWFDGWDWQVPYSKIPYQPVRDHIRSVSPDTVVANNDHKRSLETSDVLVNEVPVDGMPPEGNTTPTDASDTMDTNSTWFRTSATGPPRTAADIEENRRAANAVNSLYMLNVGPNTAGRIDEEYADVLAQVGGSTRSR